MRRIVLFLAGCATLLVGASQSSSGDNLGSRAIVVATDRELADAVARLLDSGGRIVLRPGRYRGVTVPRRSSAAAHLEIVGPRTAHVEQVVFDRTAQVSLSGVAIDPRSRDALVEVRASTEIELDDLLVTAQGTTHSASVSVPGGRGLILRRSTFTHCGDRSPEWTNCLRLYDGASDIVVEDNWFHDCYGCDFVHGRPGSGLIVRRNRFERTLPCTIGRVRCGHQDPIELFAGRWLRFEDNYFGVYRIGGAQLYLTGPIDHVAIANNLFVGIDPRVPGYRARIALVIGSAGSHQLPLHVTIANNTILTGARRTDGYAGSLRMSSYYRALPEEARPIVANNVIGLLESRWPTCEAARLFVSNVIARGRRCSHTDRVGKPYLDGHGRPTRRSTLLIDRAARGYAPVRDASGRRRGPKPDIGAFEYPARS